MKIDRQLAQVAGILENILKSGKNYHIFIDVKRSQVTYFKYVGNRDMVKINFCEYDREYDNGKKPIAQHSNIEAKTGAGGSPGG